MSYFRTLPKLPKLMELPARNERWLILINADPDAMASALALKRIIGRRADTVTIGRINEIRRPDNLAMARYTRIRMERYSPDMLSRFDRFAMVDSQPHHHPIFKDIPWSVVIDHHPLPETPVVAPYTEINPGYGATSTIMAEHLYNLDIRPGKLLATALLFGIKTDTANFERNVYDVDLRAYSYLGRFADHALLSRIARSEFHRRWLKQFAKACNGMHAVGSGQHAYLGKVDNPDVLVAIADFFMRVYDMRWAVVSGLHGGTAVVVFRGDGISCDLGKRATATFGDIGSAGGHKALARAEFPVEAMEGKNPEEFIRKRLVSPPKKGKCKAEHGAEG